MGDHEIRMRRYTRGHHPVTGRAGYGYEIECSCGWQTRCNEGKRTADLRARAHRRDAGRQDGKREEGP